MYRKCLQESDTATNPDEEAGEEEWQLDADSVPAKRSLPGRPRFRIPEARISSSEDQLRRARSVEQPVQ